jgi:Ca-activated chloride channel family protein
MNRNTLATLALLAGCGGAADIGFGTTDDVDFEPGVADTDAPSQGGALGVSQGGAQDFGQFKQILEDGNIPAANTLDDVGFFNEHKIDLPAPDCGNDVCAHAMFGTLGNMITGSDCTVVLLGLNSPIDPANLERPPLNLSIAVDTSGSMAGEPMRFVRDGLTNMLDSLVEGDRVSLVLFGTEADLVIENASFDDPLLLEAITNLRASGSTNIYDGLQLAFRTAQEHADLDRQNRVILLSDGQATAGVTDGNVILDMATTYSDFGFSTTTIGMGDDFDVDLMRQLSEVGSGAFYFLQDPSAVQEVFAEELSYFLVPLAEQVTIEATPGTAFRLRNVYGTKLFTMGESAQIDIPNLQLAHRQSDADQEVGRRGGGGAIILELLPRSGETFGQAATVDFSYTDPISGDRISQQIDVETPFDTPLSPLDGFFEEDSVDKAFVMLNLYVGFRAAAQSAEVGAWGESLSTLQNLDVAVGNWLRDNPDADIEDDHRYVRMFMDNLETTIANLEPEPVEDDGDWLWD